MNPNPNKLTGDTFVIVEWQPRPQTNPFQTVTAGSVVKALEIAKKYFRNYPQDVVAVEVIDNERIIKTHRRRR